MNDDGNAGYGEGRMCGLLTKSTRIVKDLEERIAARATRAVSGGIEALPEAVDVVSQRLRFLRAKWARRRNDVERELARRDNSMAQRTA